MLFHKNTQYPNPFLKLSSCSLLYTKFSQMLTHVFDAPLPEPKSTIVNIFQVSKRGTIVKIRKILKLSFFENDENSTKKVEFHFHLSRNST